MPSKPQTPRIVLAIGDVGGGHRSAAVALSAAIRSQQPDTTEVLIENLFDVVDPAPAGDSNRGQRLLARSGATGRLVNNFLWHLENSPAGQVVMDAYLSAVTLRAYRRRLETLAPDVVISLHPHVAKMVGRLVRAGAPFRHAVVVTDLVTLPRAWAVAAAERTTYPAPAARRALERFGVPARRLIGPLFPLAESLWAPNAGPDALHALGLRAPIPSVVFTAGGNGIRTLAPAVMALAAAGGCRMVVVCGKDEGLRTDLAAKLGGYENVRVLGFVDNLVALMGAADLVVAKPGPATILELELLGRRTVLVGDIGPQEHGNIDYALENPRFSYHRGSTATLLHTVKTLLAASPPTFTPRRRRDETFAIVDALTPLWR